MEMSGEYTISAPRQAVWEALNDPEVLKACIPGCDTLEKTSDTEMTATVTAKVGPVKAKFNGAVTLSDIDPPNGYRIAGEGKGGAAGFAKGGAQVTLSDAEGGGTLLEYTVDATVGGKLAQIGSRLIDATAKKMSGEFFGAFADMVAVAPEDMPEPEAEVAAAEPAPAVTRDPYGRRWKGYSPMTWISGGILVLMLLYAGFKYITGP
ncbi:MAG: carbon monoxide dehydrogenase [Alphaproteobacteria bacterium]|nr:carbon monoxide dehydrogenase [Alphaproteobacteria bacterium]